MRQLSVGASENVSYFTSSPPFQQESAYLVLDQWWRLLPVSFLLHSKSSYHHLNLVEVEIFQHFIFLALVLVLKEEYQVKEIMLAASTYYRYGDHQEEEGSVLQPTSQLLLQLHMPHQ